MLGLIRLVLALCLFGLALPSQALGWASQGHQAIAEAAQTRPNKTAETALARILVGGHSTTLLCLRLQRGAACGAGGVMAWGRGRGEGARGR
jgi:hypothetical protein